MSERELRGIKENEKTNEITGEGRDRKYREKVEREREVPSNASDREVQEESCRDLRQRLWAP